MKLSRRKLDPIDIDYRSRCIRSNGDFDIICYGCSAQEYKGPDANKVTDLNDDFKDKRKT